MGACFPSNYYCISSQSSTFFVTFSANPFASFLFCRVCVGGGGWFLSDAGGSGKAGDWGAGGGGGDLNGVCGGRVGGGNAAGKEGYRGHERFVFLRIQHLV